MPFDLDKPFTLLDEEKPKGFDPGKPFKLIDKPRFDTSKIQISPVNQPSQFSSGLPASVPRSDNPDWAFTQAITAPATGALAPVNRALTYTGNIARAIPADVAETIAGNEPYYELHNLAAAALGEPLPIDEKLKAASADAPTWATVGKISQGIAGTAPMLAIGGLPAATQKLILAGFTAKMMSDAPKIFTALGDEVGKPKEQQDPDKITTLVSEAFQTVGFSAAGVIGLKRAYTPPKPGPLQGPPATGAVLQRPAGALPEPPPDLGPIPGVPARGLPAPRLPEPGRTLPRPVVPETPAEPRETSVGTIRNANARTKEQIQKLFPKAELSREQAAQLRDLAWGKSTELPSDIKRIGPLPEKEVNDARWVLQNEIGQKGQMNQSDLDAFNRGDEAAMAKIKLRAQAAHREAAQFLQRFGDDQLLQLMAPENADAIHGGELPEMHPRGILDMAAVEWLRRKGHIKEPPQPTPQQIYAREIQAPATVHGDLRPPPISGPGQVPVPESGGRIQPQAEGRLPQTPPGQVPLTPPEPTPEQYTKPEESFVSKGVTRPSISARYFHAAGDAVQNPEWWVNLFQRHTRGDFYNQETAYQIGLYLRQLGDPKAGPVIAALEKARAQISQIGTAALDKFRAAKPPRKKIRLVPPPNLKCRAWSNSRVRRLNLRATLSPPSE
jgi:hypothetical protein